MRFWELMRTQSLVRYISDGGSVWRNNNDPGLLLERIKHDTRTQGFELWRVHVELKICAQNCSMRLASS